MGIGDNVYMKVGDIASNDLGTKFRAFPHGKVWWEHARFSRRSYNVIVSRLLTFEKPVNDDGSWNLRQVNATFGEDCVMEVQVNQAVLDAMEWSNVADCFLTI